MLRDWLTLSDGGRNAAVLLEIGPEKEEAGFLISGKTRS